MILNSPLLNLQVRAFLEAYVPVVIDQGDAPKGSPGAAPSASQGDVPEAPREGAGTIEDTFKVRWAGSLHRIDGSCRMDVLILCGDPRFTRFAGDRCYVSLA